MDLSSVDTLILPFPLSHNSDVTYEIDLYSTLFCVPHGLPYVSAYLSFIFFNLRVEPFDLSPLFALLFFSCHNYGTFILSYPLRAEVCEEL